MGASAALSAPATTRLRSLLAGPDVTRVIGVSDGLTARLAERWGFDALWASGLAIAAMRAMPDSSVLTMTEFLDAAVTMRDASSLPIIADCDTGFGGVGMVMRMVEQYEARGIAGVCLEDKEFPKRNSFRGGHRLADPQEFCAKLVAAKNAQSDPDFVVIARVESLIAGESMDETLRRARMYAEAGADAVLVHSKRDTAVQLTEFGREWRGILPEVPLVAVPTTYPAITAHELQARGYQVVIYASQLLRASLKAIDDSLRVIAETDSTLAIEDRVATLDDVFAVTGVERDDAVTRWYADACEAGASESELGATFPVTNGQAARVARIS
jgi:phosphoenolpyruvate phosphomutase